MREGLQAMRGSSVHATWPRMDSGHSWSFSSINSVVPRSRLPLPQAVRDAERRTGEPGVALLAGVRGENSPPLLGNIEEGKSKKQIFAAEWLCRVLLTEPVPRWQAFSAPKSIR